MSGRPQDLGQETSHPHLSSHIHKLEVKMASSSPYVGLSSFPCLEEGDELQDSGHLKRSHCSLATPRAMAPKAAGKHLAQEWHIFVRLVVNYLHIVLNFFSKGPQNLLETPPKMQISQVIFFSICCFITNRL